MWNEGHCIVLNIIKKKKKLQKNKSAFDSIFLYFINLISEYLSNRTVFRILKRYMHPHVHWSIVHSIQDGINHKFGFVDFKMWYIHTRNKKEETTAIYDILYEFLEHFSKWNKPVSEGQTEHVFHLYAAAAKSLQSCPTLCDPIDGSPLSTPVPGILQARILEWVAISFSNVWKWKVKLKSLSCVWLLATSWTGAYQVPPSMGISRQEYWSGEPLPSPLIWGIFK